ncbi:MAG: hypothetical protein WBX25_36680 [Rhodomicrobium sp.]
MKYVVVVLLILLAGNAQAQRYERDEGFGLRHREREEAHGWRHRERVRCQCWRDHVRDEGPRWVWKLVREDDYARAWAHRVRRESWRYRERERVESRGWRPERYEGRDWRPPERRGGHDFDRFAGRRCRPPMHAAGDADARREKARDLAIKSWQEQVINEYGERYLNFEAAYVLDEHCDPARVGEGGIIDLKRCVVTAAPCLTLPKEALGKEGAREEEHRQEENRPH